MTSLLSPGVGQIYNGQARKGIIIALLGNILLPIVLVRGIIIYLGTLYLSVLFLAVVIILAFYVLVLTDAICQANRFKHDYQLKKYNRWFVYIGVPLTVCALSYVIPGLNVDVDKIRARYMKAYKIPSGSMEPTILIGDHILVDRRMPARNPSRGDIIVFEYPKDETKDFIKRVEAVGGDTVEIRNKELYVNDKLVKESYVVHRESETIPASQNERDNFGPVTVPKGEYFVMGDNRDRAYDSRFWGFVDKSKIKGTARQIYWSWDSKAFAVRWDRIARKIL